jgi:hypothetical protein
MTEKHLSDLPVPLHALVSRLDELEIVFGPHVRPTLDAVRTMLISALAARDCGDMPAALAAIAGAMDRLGALADQLEPAEGAVMSALAQSFRDALLRGDDAQAKEAADVMLARSGAVPHKRD